MPFTPEQAILVGVDFQQGKQISLQESLEELKRLADTAGAETAGWITQNRPRPDIKYFIGSGKLEELKNLIDLRSADLVIFDNEVSASQERNLEEALGIKVINRTELILDIFAQHAKSREGKLQVELAQTNFLLTRLTGHGALMSRLGGGIGTRGPGETKLEYDRRRLRKKASELKTEMEKLRQKQGTRREKRTTSGIPAVSLVGYTNSGKSSLLNALTQADVPAEDKLFSTLDTVTRRLKLSSNKFALLTDTVGFIQKLPHQLIAAFKATLEEIAEANLLLHVVDISHPAFENQISAVYTVLEELNCITLPIITVFNKIDKLEGGVPDKILDKYRPSAATSAVTGEGLEQLKEQIAKVLCPLPALPFSASSSAPKKYPA